MNPERATDDWLSRMMQWVARWYGYVPERRACVQTTDERPWILGINAGSHGAGTALVRIGDGEASLMLNAEEERWSRRKHEWGFPDQSVEAAIRTMASFGDSPETIGHIASGWDFGAFSASFVKEVLRGLPGSLHLLRDTGLMDTNVIRTAPARLGARLSRSDSSVIAVPHHDAHAWGSLLLSPFHGERQTVLVLVADGMGDRGSLSVYLAKDGGTPELLVCNSSLFDSLGLMYQVLSSTQGGWSPLSCEGRYMGAAAWGEQSRESNPFYGRLRPLLHLKPEGRVELNRKWMQWHRTPAAPYGDPLKRVLGEPLGKAQMWNPDAVLDPNRISDAGFTRERLDRASAVQRLFEDGLVHILDHWLAFTGARRLVWTGGTALNCVASLTLMERYADRGVQLWVPPFPGDNGVAAGAALKVAWASGKVRRVKPLDHAFLGAGSLLAVDIEKALKAVSVSVRKIPNDQLGDFIASAVCDGQFIGLAQGAAETGPRALGHRSILADPTRADTLQRLNLHVKKRERIRPLAPVVTSEVARQFFDLPAGSEHHNFSAWRWMVLCARAKQGTAERLPAVVHADGTSRLQIVDPQADPLTVDILEAIRVRNGIAAAVNTSLNVGEPLAHTPDDVLRTLFRTRDMRTVVLVDETGLGWVVER